MIHCQKAGEIQQDTKTLCGQKLEDLPRIDGAVAFRNRVNVTCPKCIEKIRKIEIMQGQS